MTDMLVTPEELDVLLEISNVGAGNAVNSLSALLGKRRVSLCVPRVQLLPSDEIPTLVGAEDLPVIGIGLSVEGPLRGHVLIVFPREDALSLASLVTGRPLSPLDDLGRSALKEVGNILAASYVNALSRMLGGQFLPSVPTLADDRALEVLEGFHLAQAWYGQEALVLVNDFAIEEEHYLGHFLLFPDPDSLKACLVAARTKR